MKYELEWKANNFPKEETQSRLYIQNCDSMNFKS